MRSKRTAKRKQRGKKKKTKKTLGRRIPGMKDKFSDLIIVECPLPEKE